MIFASVMYAIAGDNQPRPARGRPAFLIDSPAELTIFSFPVQMQQFLCPDGVKSSNLISISLARNSLRIALLLAMADRRFRHEAAFWRDNHDVKQ
jgi:hypothetical protein